MQDEVSAGEVAVKPVAGQTSPADIGTKAHGQQQLRYLLGLLGSQSEIGGELLAHQGERPVHRLQRQLLPVLVAALGPATGVQQEEFYIRSVRREDAEEEMCSDEQSSKQERGGNESDEMRSESDEQIKDEGDYPHHLFPAVPERARGAERMAQKEPEPEDQEIKDEREPESDSEPDPERFLIWMATRLMNRMEKAMFRFDAAECIRKTTIYRQRMEILRALWHDYHTARVPLPDIYEFISTMADISEDEEGDQQCAEVTEEKVGEELSHQGVCQEEDDNVIFMYSNLPPEDAQRLARTILDQQALGHEDPGEEQQPGQSSEDPVR